MNRNILGEIEKIFDNLKAHVEDSDKERILNVKRHIKAIGDDTPVCDFVKMALKKDIYYASQFLVLFKFKDHNYLLVDEKFRDGLDEIGFEFEQDDSPIAQGAGMLAMACNALPVRQELASLELIERCLGVGPETGEDICFNFNEIRQFFLPYCVALIDNSRFDISFEEDLNRLICYLLVKRCTRFNDSAKEELKKLLLLVSSRSIAGCILNSLQSPLVEYTFLQLYQCLEYLFRLNNCFMLSATYQIDLGKSIDIVLAHEFKISESDNLGRVIRENAAEAAIDRFVGIIPGYQDANSDKYTKTSLYIYKLRCNIAHLRYQQDAMPNVNWEQCLTCLIEILYSIYEKRDRDISKVCEGKNSWTRISF